MPSACRVQEPFFGPTDDAVFRNVVRGTVRYPPTISKTARIFIRKVRWPRRCAMARAAAYTPTVWTLCCLPLPVAAYQRRSLAPGPRAGRAATAAVLPRRGLGSHGASKGRSVDA